MTVYVYALVVPGTTEPRYIGRAVDPAERLLGHCSRGASVRVREWVESLGRAPGVVILRECASEMEAQIAERATIAELRLRGVSLLNQTWGGEFARKRREERPRGMGARVRLRRQAMGLSLTELARLCGVGQPSLCRVEGGKRAMTLWNMVKLAQALGTTVEWLVTGEDVADASERSA